MHPSPAETARTLATGRLPGAIHVRQYRGRLRARHATTEDGVPLLLTRATGELAAALVPAPGEADCAVVLSVDDAPPTRGAPSHGRLWLSGWARLLGGAEARAAADEYARVNPTGDLLGVGDGHALYRMEVGEVHLARGETLVDVDADEFGRARPDPVHASERDLLDHLNTHHRENLVTLAATLAARPSPIDCRAVRLDRYGLTLEPATGDGTRRLTRVAYPRPARDAPDVARLLHSVLHRTCRGGAGWHATT